MPKVAIVYRNILFIFAPWFRSHRQWVNLRQGYFFFLLCLKILQLCQGKLNTKRNRMKIELVVKIRDQEEEIEWGLFVFKGGGGLRMRASRGYPGLNRPSVSSLFVLRGNRTGRIFSRDRVKRDIYHTIHTTTKIPAFTGNGDVSIWMK